MSYIMSEILSPLNHAIVSSAIDSKLVAYYAEFTLPYEATPIKLMNSQSPISKKL